MLRPAFTQTITGNITGTVTDTSGAVVANARVIATNTATNVAVATTTNGAGIYSIRFLQIGQYRVSTEANGFSRQNYGPFALEIDQTAKVDVALAIGAGSTTVDVSAEIQPILNTENATLGETFTENTINSIPLNGRDFSQLTVFTPGAVSTNYGQFGGQNSVERDTNGGTVANINGNRAQSNYLLDGQEINENLNNTVGYTPSPDSLDQIRVISSNANAEFGNVHGGDVVMVTKSGTNHFHGSVFGFLENYNLDANSASTATPILRRTIGRRVLRLFLHGSVRIKRFSCCICARVTISSHHLHSKWTIEHQTINHRPRLALYAPYEGELMLQRGAFRTPDRPRSQSFGGSTMQKQIRSLSLWVAILAAFCCGSAFSQTITGDISGTVTDASGAVVPNAKVTATNVDTGVTASATTNSSGTYSIRFLQIGRYKVLIEDAGFASQSVPAFSLEVAQTAKIDGKLTAGTASTVEVSSSLAPILNTEDSSIATVLTASTIENIPLSGRNWSSLTLFTPGAISTNPSSFGGAGNQNAIERNQQGGGNSQAQVNGNRAEGNNYRLDGIEINETLNNLVGYNPNPDAISQLQIISANAPAQYGNVNGGDIIALTKSGTNQFHGSAAIFLQNYQLDANTWANKNVAAGTLVTPRNPYTQTQYSGTVGGPIIKDKLFFFADYFGTRYHKGGQTTASVLTAKMRTGDFSELLNPAIMGSNPTIQLYDPSNNYAPFVNNKIPITNAAVAYLAAHPEYYPLPNIAPNNGSPVSNNYRGNTTSRIVNDQGDIKVDYTPTANDRFFVRYFQGQASDSMTHPLAIAFPGSSIYPDKGVAIDYSRVLSSAIVNNLRAGFTRVRWNQGNPVDATGNFGLTGNKLLGIPSAQAFAGFASQSVSSLTEVGDTHMGNAAGGTNFIDNTFVYADDLSWQRGKHLLNLGVDLVRYQQNNFYAGNDGANGTFTYNGVFTSNPNVRAPGYAPADWALDRVTSSGVGAVGGRTGQRQWRSAYYVQDDWKIMPTLTLNLGLRYEYFQPIYEVNNKTSNYDPASGKIAYAGSIPAGAVPNATVCKNRSCLNSYYNNFMPRIGFAYQATPRFVVRGGFGITKAMEGTGANLRLTYNAPFANSLEANGTNPTAASGGRFLKEANGFTAPNGAADIGGFPRIEDPNIKPQQTNEYSLTTEYQINNASSVKVSYVGETSQHLIQALRPNQLTRACVVGGVVVDPNSFATQCAASDPAPFLNLVGENGFVFETISEGAANYNGLQAQYRQRMTKGLEFTVNYAFAHAFSNSAGFFGVAGTNAQGPYAQNQYDNAAEWGPTASDVRHSVNGTAVYAIPFGRGRTYGGNSNFFVNELLGGWKASMTGIVYSGLPVTVSANNVAQVNNHCCSSRPNQISNVKANSHTLANWFGGLGTGGSGKYAAPTVGTFGNGHNGTERAPGFQQYDLSLFKDFTIFHENRIGFRADAYNVLNITSLGNPSNNFSGGNFGQITDVKSVPRQLTLSAKYQF